ncbi:hypothetical protein THIOKS12140009 [Thiocapsa sp. KS1]|nr:hypothetical protein THIOKS12140009 [Thiocapsa sp. KS1]
MRNLVDGLAAPAPTISEPVRFKVLKILNSKPRLTGIKDISEAKRTMKTAHVALDAVKAINVEQFERVSQRWSDDPSSSPSTVRQPAGSSRA